jgi:hypothetical protein
MAAPAFRLIHASYWASWAAARIVGKQLSPVDRLGKSIAVGTRVRVLKITPFLKDSVPPEEWDDLQTMVGEVFPVCEVDEYGWPWVEKWFESKEEGSYCHSLALAPDEMEVVP